MFDILRKAEKR